MVDLKGQTRDLKCLKRMKQEGFSPKLCLQFIIVVISKGKNRFYFLIVLSGKPVSLQRDICIMTVLSFIHKSTVLIGKV